MVALCILAVTVTGIHPIERSYSTLTDSFGLTDEFESYVKQFGKQYSTDEWEPHYKAFEANYRFVQNETQQQKKYSLVLNRFADMELCDIQEKYFGIKLPADGLNLTRPVSDFDGVDGSDVGSVDWVQEGAVTVVKDQGACGSCWAFSSTGALEGAYMIKTGMLLNLSEQELVNGTNGMTVNAGCDGGWMFTAFEFVADYGIDTEASVPYTSYYGTGDGPDLILTGGVVGIPEKVVSGFEWVTQTSTSLMSAISKQPISVAIEVSSMSFILYSSGVLAIPKCGTSVNHAVLAVGYSTEDDDPFWLIKNSWSADWGDNGYIKLAMDSTQTYDTCAIAGYAFLPTFDS